MQRRPIHLWLFRQFVFAIPRSFRQLNSEVQVEEQSPGALPGTMRFARSA
jgi:hypothetical protein